jgi:hypothetical protein
MKKTTIKIDFIIIKKSNNAYSLIKGFSACSSVHKRTAAKLLWEGEKGLGLFCQSVGLFGHNRFFLGKQGQDRFYRLLIIWS